MDSEVPSTDNGHGTWRTGTWQTWDLPRQLQSMQHRRPVPAGDLAVGPDALRPYRRRLGFRFGFERTHDRQASPTATGIGSGQGCRAGAVRRAADDRWRDAAQRAAVFVQRTDG